MDEPALPPPAKGTEDLSSTAPRNDGHQSAALTTHTCGSEAASRHDLEILSEYHLRPVRRRISLPLVLFLLTCLSTFWAGTTRWRPLDDSGIRSLILDGGSEGALYMLCVLAILLAHEMGHFVATVIHRVPASLPIFIPFPLTPIGTLGAIIAMDGRRANRRQIFDIGIAGPLAGLIVALPILAVGVTRLDLESAPRHQEIYDCPVLIEWMIHWFHPSLGDVDAIAWTQLNAYFMAGWVGLLITGLNMLPVSQLDGGHVIYSLFGKQAHWIARAFIFFAILFTVLIDDAMIWWPMIILVVLMGTDHPPTSNDFLPLGWPRIAIGCASLLIPVLCFPVRGVIFPY
jgi:Zn-dependent protease